MHPLKKKIVEVSHRFEISSINGNKNNSSKYFSGHARNSKSNFSPQIISGGKSNPRSKYPQMKQTTK